MNKYQSGVLTSAVFAFAAIWGQYSISQNIVDDFQSEWRDLPESATNVTVDTNAGLFKAEATRRYTTEKGNCYEEHEEQTHVFGLPVNSSNYGRPCGLD